MSKLSFDKKTFNWGYGFVYAMRCICMESRRGKIILRLSKMDAMRYLLEPILLMYFR